VSGTMLFWIVHMIDGRRRVWIQEANDRLYARLYAAFAGLTGTFVEIHELDAWLDGSAGKEVLKPTAEDMLQKWPVSKRVNSSKAPGDDPTLIEPVALAAYH
jgi:hypothetical protein